MRCEVLAVITLAVTVSASAAVHPSKAQDAYFREHEKCVSSLRAAKKDAEHQPTAERKKAVEAAKEQYRKCEAYARLVWKYYPDPPPKQ